MANAAAARAAAPTPEEERLHAVAAALDDGDAAVEELAALLLAGVDANAADANGKTALHFAAEAGNKAAAMLLLGRGANVAATIQDADDDDHNGWQPLHFAANGHRAAMVALLLAHGADANAANASGSTPLRRAVGDIATLRAFLDAGVPADAPCTYYGTTALHQAAHCICEDAAALLVERGTNVNATTSGGDTPLLLLLDQQVADDGDDYDDDNDDEAFGALLDLLLAAGADVNAANSNGAAPLHRAAELVAIIEVAGTVRKLLVAGARLEAADFNDRRPLHYATDCANLGAVKELLKGGADVHARYKNSATALHLACKAPDSFMCKREVIEALLKAGADAKAEDSRGRQPMHYAAVASFWPDDEEMDAEEQEEHRQSVTDEAKAVVALLKAAGADINATDADGDTPLMLAVDERNDNPTIPGLLENGARVGTPECRACADRDAAGPRRRRRGRAGAAAAQTRRARGAAGGAAAGVRGARGGPALTPERRLRAAATHRGGDAVEELAALLLAGVDVNAADADGKTALHIAVEAGNKVVAMLLLGRGADVAATALAPRGLHCRRPAGWQPLHFAAHAGHAELVALLVARGADATAADVYGRTPMFFAIDNGRVQAARALLNAGVPAGAVCHRNGSTALHAATLRQNKDLALLLLERGANVNAGDADGDTPLHDLMIDGGGDEIRLELLALLLAAGANVNAANKRSATPLHVAAREQYAAAATSTVRALLAAGARFEAEDDGRCRPLHNATMSANLDAVEALLERGADVHARDGDGTTPLDLACGAALHSDNETAC